MRLIFLPPIAAALMSSLLGNCSDIYMDRRDSISLSAGDAMASNRVTQMIDPWPAASGKHNIAYNGEKAARAYKPDMSPNMEEIMVARSIEDVQRAGL